MGSVCARRRSAPPADEQEEWLLIQPRIRRPMFQAAAQRVIHLLALRKLWHRLGQFLASQEGKASPRRSLLQATWAQLGSKLNQNKQLFRHLFRQNGVLKYRQ